MFGIIPRMYFAQKYGLWNDEIGAARTFTNATGLWDYLQNGLFRDTVPPLYNLFGYISVRLSHTVDFGFRLPAILFSTLTVFPMAALARKISGNAAGIFTALFAAFAPIAIRYGYDARPYSLEAFLISIVWLQLHQADEKGWKTTNGTFFILSLTLACFSHYFALISVGALLFLYLGLPFIIRRAKLVKAPPSILSVSVLMVAASAIVHLWLISRQNVSRSEYFTDYSPEFLWQYFSMLWQTDVIGLHTPMWRDVNLVTPVLLGLMIIGLVAVKKDIRVLCMFIVLLFGVIGIPLVATLSHNLLSIRFSMFALPCMILFLGCGMGQIVTWCLLVRGNWYSQPIRIVTLLIPATLITILALDTKRFLDAPYFQEWREKAYYYDSLVKREAIDQAVASNVISARNIGFYTTNPIMTHKPSMFDESQDAAAKTTVFFDMHRDAVINLYKRSNILVTLVEIAGVTPKVILSYPSTLPPEDRLAIALEEHSYMHRYVVPEHRSWVYSQMGQIADRLGKPTLANLAFQLLYLNAGSDIDRGYALWQMGSPELAISYYENYFSTTPDRKIRDYMTTQYRQLQQELREK